MGAPHLSSGRKADHSGLPQAKRFFLVAHSRSFGSAILATAADTHTQQLSCGAHAPPQLRTRPEGLLVLLPASCACRILRPDFRVRVTGRTSGHFPDGRLALCGNCHLTAGLSAPGSGKPSQLCEKRTILIAKHTFPFGSFSSPSPASTPSQTTVFPANGALRIVHKRTQKHPDRGPPPLQAVLPLWAN